MSRGLRARELNHIKADSIGLGVVGSLARGLTNMTIMPLYQVPSSTDKNTQILLLCGEIGLAVAHLVIRLIRLMYRKTSNINRWIHHLNLSLLTLNILRIQT